MTLSKLNIYIEDDWNDNKLKDRDNVSEGYFMHPSDNLLGGSSPDPGAYSYSGDVEAGDVLKGIYRPDWISNNGAPTTSNGKLSLEAGDSVKTPSDQVVGIWQHTFEASSGGNHLHAFCFIGDYSTGVRGVNDGYRIQVSDAGDSYDLQGFGMNIKSTWSTDTNTHNTKVTRDSYGNFEFYLDGDSRGTAVNTALPSQQNIIQLGESDSTTKFDNLEVK